MKTKIRTQTGKTDSSGVKYNYFIIDVLTSRFKGARYLEPMGQITFQSNADKPNDWYGMHFVVNTDNVRHIKEMTKIAEHIQKGRSGFNAQPKEIIELIGGEEYVCFDSEFISKLDNGKNIYRVILQGNLYDKITAKDEAEAKKLLAKKKIEGASLQFHTKIDI